MKHTVCSPAFRRFFRCSHFRMIMLLLSTFLLAFTACAFPPVHPTNNSRHILHSASEAGANRAESGLHKAKNDNSPLVLSIKDAILMALENNVSFRIDRLQPEIAATEEQVQRAAFDPTVSATLQGGVSRDSGDGGTDGESVSASVGLDQFLPYGTTLDFSVGPAYQSTDNGTDTETNELEWDAGLTQPLLKGWGMPVNLAKLYQAQLDTEMSIHELRGAAEALLAQTEQTAWEYVLAARSIAIYEKSLEVAGQQLEEVKERIRVGKLAETEMAAVEAEKANRLEQLINARADLMKKHLALIRLLNPGSGPDVWDRKVKILDVPEMKPIPLSDIESYIRSAMKNRPDLGQARLEIEKGDLEVIRTKNGLLPQLDLFLRIGGSHYSDSFSDRDDTDGDATTLTTGVNFELPFGNREAAARHDRAQYSLQQSKLALQNMEQLIQVDVRSAFVDVKRNEEQINATRVTRYARQKTLNMEQEKFRVGKSTAFIVAQAQRDLVAGEIAEVEAVIEYRKSLLNLYRLDGSLLNRRGIEVPASQ